MQSFCSITATPLHHYYKTDAENDSIRDKVRDKFGTSSGQIIGLIQQNPSITLDNIAAHLSVTRRSIEKKIKELRDADIIKRTGSNKSGLWTIIHSNL